MMEEKQKETKCKQPKIKTLRTKVLLVTKGNIIVKINNQNIRIKNLMNKKQGDIVEIKYQGNLGSISFQIVN